MHVENNNFPKKIINRARIQSVNINEIDNSDFLVSIIEKNIFQENRKNVVPIENYRSSSNPSRIQTNRCI